MAKTLDCDFPFYKAVYLHIVKPLSGFLRYGNLDNHLMEDMKQIMADDAEIGWARYVENSGPPGAQGTVRIAALLRIVAAHNSTGLRLNEISALAGLEQSTAHRIVSALHSVGFLAREPGSRRFHLGSLLFELFTTAFPHFNIREICLPAMSSLAERMGDTVYLTVRSGFEGICIERREGSYPIRTCTVEVGQRRPLGVGAGNLALLASLKDMEVKVILDHTAPHYAAFGLSKDIVLDRIRKARSDGFIYQNAVSSTEVNAVAMTIKGRPGPPFGALSMTAITPRMPVDRAQELVTEMKREIEKIEQKISELGFV